MKKFLQRSFLMVIVLGVSSKIVDAQIKFKSGAITPKKNIDTFFEDGKAANSFFYNSYYLTVTFDDLPSYEERAKLKSYGIQFIDYLPNLSYTVKLAPKFDLTRLKSIGAISLYEMTPAQKVEADLLQKIIPLWAMNGERVALEIVLMDEFALEQLENSIATHDGEVKSFNQKYRMLSLEIPVDNVQQLAKEPWLMWMEPKHAPVSIENNPGKINHRSAILQDGVRSLSGKGVTIGVCDAGKAGKHLDYDDRLTQYDGSSAKSHSCHVAGTLISRGLINPKARGMAPDANLISYTFSGDRIAKVQEVIDTFGILVSSNSYGGSHNCNGDPYTIQSRAEDLVTNNNPQLVYVFSSGNNQHACSGGFNTLTEKATKNTIVVGNVSNLDVLAGDSSFGPTEDGRIKPELTATGRSVYSTYPGDRYSQKSGTSMATPGVAGTAAQVIQRYRELNGNADPSGVMVKALMCNSAYDLGNAGPDYKYGFGRINLLKTIETVEQSRYKMDSVATGANNDITINVPSGVEELKVLTSWYDPAGAANVNPALVNNLNLEVIDPSNTVWHPWVLDGNNPGSVAQRMADSINPTEQVTISTPVAGAYTIRVKGIAVPTGSKQQYALTWEMNSPYIKIVHPSGNEMLSPGSTQYIQWDRTGLSGNQTIEFSADSGATWSVVTSTLSAGSNKYTWTVPSVQTSKALVKITNGSISNTSEMPFKIIGVPANLTLSSDACGIKVDWDTVANATGYDVLLMDTVDGIWNVVGADVPTNTYVVGGLTAGTRYWITVRSRNASKGITGQRARATYFHNQNASGATPTVIVNGINLSTQTASSYQWLFNGVIIPGATNQNHTASQNGMYSVIVTNANGCKATSIPVPVVSLDLLDNEEDISFNIYPNPNNGLLNVLANGIEENATIVISNVLGEQLSRMEFSSNEVNKQINISGYSNGVYFVTLQTEKIKTVKRLIKN